MDSKTSAKVPVALPIYQKASVAVERGWAIHATVPVAKLSRLTESTFDAQGQLAVDLRAFKGVDGGRFLCGRITGAVTLQCQRCLGAMPWHIDHPFELRLVFSEAEEERWLKDAEPYLVEDDRLPLHDLVSDEVLLGLPMFAYCPDTACNPSAVSTKAPELSDNIGLSASASDASSAGPLASLKHLKL